MADSRIEASVQRIGRRITEVREDLTIEDIYDIDFTPSEKDTKEFESSPEGFIERLLKQEGHKVNRVEISAENRPFIRQRPGRWFHIDFDKYHPERVSYWIYLHI